MSSIKLGFLNENDKKAKWKYFKITLISFEMYNMYKSVEK
jgi:hypothetical protein